MTRMTRINYNLYSPFSYGWWRWLLAMAMADDLNLEPETLNLKPIHPCLKNKWLHFDFTLRKGRTAPQNIEIRL